MKILIYGAGVIGSIFATKLALSGQDVTMLARGKRIEELNEKGSVICNPKTGKEEIARVKVIDKLLPEMEYDYIFVVMQKTQVNSVVDTLAQNCSKNIVFVVNTALGYDEWVYKIGADRLIIGFPSAGGERINGVVNYFVGKGLMRGFQTTTFGEAGGESSQRVKHLIKMFCHAGIPAVHCSDMDSWQKTHVAMVTSIANALYEYDCNNKRLSDSYKSVKNMIIGIKEGFAVLRQIGTKTTPFKLNFFILPSDLLAVFFKIFMNTQLAEITMAKHCVAAKQEMICLQEEFDILIKKSGMKTPYIDKLRKNLLH